MDVCSVPAVKPRTTILEAKKCYLVNIIAKKHVVFHRIWHFAICICVLCVHKEVYVALEALVLKES